MKEFYASPLLSSTCNVNARLSHECLLSVMGEAWFKTYLKASLLVKQYPLLQSNPECVKETFTSDYWELGSYSTAVSSIS
jgi:hypothetical protein